MGWVKADALRGWGARAPAGALLLLVLGVAAALLAAATSPALQAAGDRPRFSEPLLLSDPSHAIGEPAIATGPGEEIYVVWGARPAGCSSNIYFTRSTDGGESFSVARNLSEIPCESILESSEQPGVAVDPAGDIYVVWRHNGPGGPPPNQVYFARSTDRGVTFTEPRNISNSPPITPSPGALAPDLAVGAPAHVCVAWSDRYDLEQLDQIFVSCSTDGGDSFSSPVQVSFRPEGWSGSSFPGVAVVPAGPMFVGWHQARPGAVDVFLSRSVDGGTSFSTPLDLSEGLFFSQQPKLAVDAEGTIYVVWHTLQVTSWETMFRRSVDGGLTFSPMKRITRRRHGSSIAQGIAVGRPGHVCVAWTEFGKDSDIFARCSFDSGETFRKRFNASGRLGWEQGDVAADPGGNVHVVFGGDLRSINPDAWWTGVYFRRSLEPLP